MDGVMALLFLATAATLHQPTVSACSAAAAVSVRAGLDPISAALAASCREGTYFNVTSYNRMETNATLCDCCHPLCVECYGPSSEQCYSCNSTFIMRTEEESGAGGSGGMMVAEGGELIKDLTRNWVTCVAECPEGLQVDETSSKCVRCRNFLLDGVCVSQCPDGYTGEIGGNCTLVEGIPLGALIGITVGGGVLLLAVLLSACLCLCCCVRRRKTRGKAEVYTPMEDEVKGELVDSKKLHLLSQDEVKLDLENNQSFTPSTSVLPLHKSLSSGNIRDTDLSLPLPPHTPPLHHQGIGRNTSYVQMSSAGSIRPSKSLGDIAEDVADYDIYSIPGRKVASLLVASGTPSDTELLSHPTRSLALSDPSDGRRINLTLPLLPHSKPLPSLSLSSPHNPSPSPPPSSHHPSRSPTTPLSPNKSASPSPHHSNPTTPLGQRKLAPPSPRHSSTTPSLSSKKPALLPKPRLTDVDESPLSSKKPALLPKPRLTDVDEYVDPRVFKEDYERSVDSYVNKETIQSLSYTSNSRSLETTYESLEQGMLAENRAHDDSSGGMQHPETQHESRGNGMTETRGTAARGTEIFGAGTGKREGPSESPGEVYENLKEFLGDPSDTTASHSYAEVREELQEQRYENIDNEGIYIQDDYTTVDEFLKSAGSSKYVKDMGDERRGSQDNEYVYMVSQRPHPEEVGRADITGTIRHASEPTKRPHKYANLDYVVPLGDEDNYTTVLGEEDQLRRTSGPSVMQGATEVVAKKGHMVELEFPARREGSGEVMQNGRPVRGEEEGEDHLYINVERVEEEEQLYQNIVTASTH